MSNHDFQTHECKGKRKMSDMRKDLLLKVATKQMTEEKAWAIQEAKEAEVYWQPKSAGEGTIMSFEVYHQEENARKEHPNDEILRFTGEDIEDHVYLDECTRNWFGLNEAHTLIDCVEGADLIRINETGKYCWHKYDPEGDPADGKFSVDYPTIKAAKDAWPNVEWEDFACHNCGAMHSYGTGWCNCGSDICENDED